MTSSLITLIDDQYYHFLCPHCQLSIIVFKNELNCKIFRHAIFKDSYKQVDPHLSKDQCDYLLHTNKVFGCAKPFQIIYNNNMQLIAQICDYI